MKTLANTRKIYRLSRSDTADNTLANIRKTYGLSRAVIANATGLSVAAIGHYERGDRQPRISTARVIVAAVKKLTNGAAVCSIESLFPTTKN